LAEKDKYDLFLEELAFLENQVYALLQKGEELTARNKELEKEVKQLQNENEVLKLKLEECGEIESRLKNSVLTDSEREALKKKIDDLLKRIDYHMRS
jgi:predicted RNase H-like nuclease (RuvC/YqgF family)